MRKHLSILACGLILTPPMAVADTIQTEAGPVTLTTLVDGLDSPWAADHLPDGTILITEIDGRLIAVADGTRREIAGLPDDIAVGGQGGLLDIMVPRDFADTRDLFFTYSKRQSDGAGTAVFRARLSDDGTTLERGVTIFEMTAGNPTQHHYGSRLVESRDGTLFVTVGERGNGPLAQDVTRHNGSVLHLTRDGAAAPGNPFTGDALPELWSIGHRNPQGAALDATGQLWVVEHGAKGGDEVNRITPGANYGWPVISYGTNYNGSKIGVGTARDGMEQPVYYWDPSIAPSGMTFYDGPIADWQGCAFVGSLKFDYVSRLCGTPLAEVERIASEATVRVRDVTMGPDGALWVLSEINGALYALTPTE